MKNKFQLNLGTGMALGAIMAAIVSLIVQLITNDIFIWTWAIPVGIAIGMQMGIVSKKKRNIDNINR
jgi:ABC-type dipeptide/oligopeptide/nickel transport system permease component